MKKSTLLALIREELAKVLESDSDFAELDDDMDEYGSDANQNSGSNTTLPASE